MFYCLEFCHTRHCVKITKQVITLNKNNNPEQASDLRRQQKALPEMYANVGGTTSPVENLHIGFQDYVTLQGIDSAREQAIRGVVEQKGVPDPF